MVVENVAGVLFVIKPVKSVTFATFHAPMFWLNAVALWNIKLIFVTDIVLNDNGWLNARALVNILLIFVTDIVFKFNTLLKFVVCVNIPCIVVTAEVLKDNDWLKIPQAENISFILVINEVSQEFILLIVVKEEHILNKPSKEVIPVKFKVPWTEDKFKLTQP